MEIEVEILKLTWDDGIYRMEVDAIDKEYDSGGVWMIYGLLGLLSEVNLMCHCYFPYVRLALLPP